MRRHVTPRFCGHPTRARPAQVPPLASTVADRAVRVVPDGRRTPRSIQNRESVGRALREFDESGGIPGQGRLGVAGAAPFMSRHDGSGDSSRTGRRRRRRPRPEAPSRARDRAGASPPVPSIRNDAKSPWREPGSCATANRTAGMAIPCVGRSSRSVGRMSPASSEGGITARAPYHIPARRSMNAPKCDIEDRATTASPATT